jgi:hypothetical protein
MNLGKDDQRPSERVLFQKAIGEKFDRTLRSALRISSLKKLSLANAVTVGKVIGQRWMRTKRFQNRWVPRMKKRQQTQRRDPKRR